MLRAAILVIAAGILAAKTGAGDDDRAAEREGMVAAIERQALATGGGKPYARLDDKVLGALRKVPRHAFVPAGAAASAYADRPLDIGSRQTISQPFIVALMTHLLKVRQTDRVLEIGTGSGYQAAVLSLLAREVYSVEVLPALGARAAGTLSRLGYANVATRIGDGSLGWQENAPYGRIIVTAAAPQVPPALIAQLKPGGRLVIPVGVPGAGFQDLMVIDKAADGTTTGTSMLPVRFVPLTPAAPPR